MIKLQEFKGRIASSLNELYKAMDIEIVIKGEEVNWKVASLYNSCLDNIERDDYSNLEDNLIEVSKVKGNIEFEVIEFKNENEDIQMIRDSFSVPLNDEKSLW